MMRMFDTVAFLGVWVILIGFIASQSDCKSSAQGCAEAPP